MRGTTISKTWAWNPTLYAPSRYRKACKYEAFVPSPLAGTSFDLSSSTAAAVSDAEQAILSLNDQATPSLAPLARLLLRTEAIASSKVEGLQVDIRQLARAESKMETGGKGSPTVLEVLRNIGAMQLAVEQATEADSIGIKHIAEIHQKLMAGAPMFPFAGVVRTEQNWVGGNDYNPCGADFVPPPPEEVHRLLEDLCQAIAEDSLSPLVQAAMVHAQFETIHPFLEGNGRTGRALIHVVLRRRGIAVSYVPPISVLLAAQRDSYIGGLVDFRDGRVDSWIERFAAACAQSAALAANYIQAVSQLKTEWRERLSSGPAPRSDAAAWAIIEILPAHPIVTAPVAAAVTGRAKAAVYQALDQLVEGGVLEPISTSRRNRAWEAVGLLGLLENLEAGQAPNAP